MNHKRITKLVAGLIAATAMVAPLAAQAADRVEQEIKRERGTNNGISGYWVTVKERTYRWDPMLNERIAQLYPGGTGLTAYELDSLLAAINASGQQFTSAQLKAAIDAFKAWKASVPGPGSAYTAGAWGSVQQSQVNNLSDRLAAALGIPASGVRNVATNLVNRTASDRSWVYDPLVFDLNGNGKIDVTGASTAKIRAPHKVGFIREGSVLFDIRGRGKADRIEWVKSGDGILVDNRKDAAKQLVAQGKPLSIHNLLGDTDGNTGGFMKLARLFDAEARIASTAAGVRAEGLGLIKGAELNDLLMWIDNGDGKAELKELHTLASLGITEIKLPNRHIVDGDGELIEEATFIRNGQPFKIQEVWFAGEADGTK